MDEDQLPWPVVTAVTRPEQAPFDHVRTRTRGGPRHQHDLVGVAKTALGPRRIADVRLSYASTQWGSCSPKGLIMLNTTLLFVTPAVLRYVVIHELAHRRRADHSPAYWREVERVLPQYRTAREKLHGYRICTL